ncbi:MAG: hypothetical protein ACTS44_00820 [Candidatus Hodgkinia cicadicola]
MVPRLCLRMLAREGVHRSVLAPAGTERRLKWSGGSFEMTDGRGIASGGEPWS